MKTCLIGGRAAASPALHPNSASSAPQTTVQPHLLLISSAASDLVALEQLLADHHALDLGRALADQEERCIAVEPLDLVLLRIPVAAMNPERVLDDLLAGL